MWNANFKFHHYHTIRCGNDNFFLEKKKTLVIIIIIWNNSLLHVGGGPVVPLWGVVGRFAEIQAGVWPDSPGLSG